MGDIKVSFGMLAYFTWLEGPGIPSNRTVTVGQPVGCASGVTHALFAGPDGAVFHESLSRIRETHLVCSDDSRLNDSKNSFCSSIPMIPMISTFPVIPKTPMIGVFQLLFNFLTAALAPCT